MKPTT
jgi:molecular chaperone GrpE